jgi:hypothetical protein
LISFSNCKVPEVLPSPIVTIPELSTLNLLVPLVLLGVAPVLKVSIPLSVIIAFPVVLLLKKILPLLELFELSLSNTNPEAPELFMLIFAVGLVVPIPTSPPIGLISISFHPTPKSDAAITPASLPVS